MSHHCNADHVPIGKGMCMRSFLTSACRRSLLLLLLPLALGGAVRADEVTDWHEHMLAALGNAGVSPVVSTRDAALVSAAVFDAVNGIERRYEPILVPAVAPQALRSEPPLCRPPTRYCSLASLPRLPI